MSDLTRDDVREMIEELQGKYPSTILEAEDCEMEEWNSYSHGKIYAPKGTFQKILEAEE